MRFALAAALLCVACHGHGHEPYATFQACFDEHTDVESLAINEAIVVCCLDHDIAGTPAPACGASAAECVTYLSVNLTAGATVAEKSAACDEYIVQKGM